MFIALYKIKILYSRPNPSVYIVNEFRIYKHGDIKGV